MLADSEWATHQQRDTAALIMASNPLLSLVAISDGECKARSRFEMCEVSTLVTSVCSSHAVSRLLVMIKENSTYAILRLPL